MGAGGQVGDDFSMERLLGAAFGQLVLGADPDRAEQREPRAGAGGVVPGGEVGVQVRVGLLDGRADLCVDGGGERVEVCFGRRGLVEVGLCGQRQR